MKSKSKKRRIMALLMVLAGLAFADARGYGIVSFATGYINSQDVLDKMTAGAAKWTEADTDPSEAELQAIRQEKRNELAEANAEWKQPGALVMADVVDSVNVRCEPSEDAEKAGKLYKDCGGYILEYTDEWTKIESGNLVGWVSNQYLMFGDAAKATAEDVGVYRATIKTQTLRVRKEPSVDSEVYGLVAEGDTFDVVEQTDDWLVIDFEGANGYINDDYVEINFHVDYGETMASIEAREQAEQEAKEAAARRQNQSTSHSTTQSTSRQNLGQYAADASDVELLGALIQCEAGNQSYEGKLAVGAVVMNRVRSSAYPNSIYSVIYASGQFSPAGSGAVDKRLQNGVSSSCLQAAQEAISGTTNVGNATHFRPAGNHDGIVIGGHVFW